MRTAFLALFLFLQCATLRAEEEKNVLFVCDNGVEMFLWDLDFISHAKESIEVLPCFLGGDIARDLLNRIEERLEEVPGIKVHLISSPVLIEPGEMQLIEELKRRYPSNFLVQFSTQVVQMLPEISSIDNHVKMCVVDEHYFSAGGTNLEQAHCAEGSFTNERGEDRDLGLADVLPAGMRDQDIIGKGPLAKELRKVFFQLFSIWEHYNETGLLEKDPSRLQHLSRYFPVHEKGVTKRFDVTSGRLNVPQDAIRVILGGPHQRKNAITEEYVRLINQAKQEVIIENLYFFPVAPIYHALIAAVNRGVKLTVITNGKSETSPESTDVFCWLNRVNYVPMIYGQEFHTWFSSSARSQTPKKTAICEYNVPDILLHKKMMLVDGHITLVGSYNLGFKSAHGDYELVLVIDSLKVAQKVKEVHEKDLENSRQISPSEACDWYFDPITSYRAELQRKYQGFL